MEHLVPEIREVSTVSSFKNELFPLIQPPQKPTYGLYDLTGLASLTQLRAGLSKLKSHKFNHNLCETFYQMCLINGRIEDTEQFLLQCHKYSEQRPDFLGVITEVV